MTTSSTLADSLLTEMTRVRDQVIPGYLAIGPTGIFALTMMRRDLDASAKALAEGDAVACIRCLESLRGFST